MKVISIFKLLMAIILIVVLSSCGDNGNNTVKANKPNNSPSVLKQTNTNHKVLHAIKNEKLSIENSDAGKIEKASSKFNDALAMANKMEGETLDAETLTDEKIQSFIDTFPNPWDADTTLWSKYINTTDSNKLLVAQLIFEYMIDNYKDPKIQAYAHNHLGRVFFQREDYKKALEFYEAVELQPDGDDFWYVDSKDEAGWLSATLMDINTDKEKRDYYYDRAVDNYLSAISACKIDKVKATMHYLLGYTYINKDYAKSLETFKKSADLYEKAGSEKGHKQAEEAYKHYKKMFSRVLNLNQ